MNQKKHLNAIAALEASKDAEPGNLWQRAYCADAACSNCYGINTLCRGIINCSGLGLLVSDVRAALQSGLDAYNKRKAEKAKPPCNHIFTGSGGIDAREGCKHCGARYEDVVKALLIPDPPDTPEVRALIEHLARPGMVEDGCGMTGEFCEMCCFADCCSYRNRQARHAFARSWLSRHPAVWDAEKGPYPVAMVERDTGKGMRTFDGIPYNYLLWRPATIAEVLPLIFDGPRQFAEEARRQGWKR